MTKILEFTYFTYDGERFSPQKTLLLNTSSMFKYIS